LFFGGFPARLLIITTSVHAGHGDAPRSRCPCLRSTRPITFQPRRRFSPSSYAASLRRARRIKPPQAPPGSRDRMRRNYHLFLVGVETEKKKKKISLETKDQNQNQRNLRPSGRPGDHSGPSSSSLSLSSPPPSESPIREELCPARTDAPRSAIFFQICAHVCMVTVRQRVTFVGWGLCKLEGFGRETTWGSFCGSR
jgi:hypothetical protein